MLGFNYAQFDATRYVMHYQGGKVRREGPGLSFFYFSPTSSIVSVPVNSHDLPFIFSETTADFQPVTIQGQITYRISDPKRLSRLLDFTVDEQQVFKTDDPEKLDQRVVNEAQAAVAGVVRQLNLKQAIKSQDAIEKVLAEGLPVSEAIEMLGLNILGVKILA